MLCGKIAPDLADKAAPCGSGMHLSDHDLLQLDDAYLEGLSPEQARALLAKALADLKVARERLAQKPSNSSRPPSLRAPWERVEDGNEDHGDSGSASGDAAAQQGEQPAPAVASRGRRGDRPSGDKPGRRKGAPGHSRTQVLLIDAEQVHATRAFALLVSVIETCRKRRASPWTYLADVVRQRRRNLPAPPLPRCLCLPADGMTPQASSAGGG
ncbi:hypothetical protein [uncultured Thiohalocapsa sp.]|uniref:hypothetical protein n=1 Tax=uncultured Thiohalocapsa sp. TaxID=768990 RepID=UPI0025F90C6E|nr:hypothetical protein [uncultured Thiohalocapsa sp.]